MTISAPPPQGAYLPATIHGDIIYTAGMTPRKNGNLLFEGVIGDTLSIESAKVAAAQAAKNAVDAVLACAGPSRHITQCLRMTVYLVCTTGFTDHSKIADAASDYVMYRLGTETNGVRTTIGVAGLPGGAPVEIELTTAIAH
ncbi:RidA family protein [Nocardia carnea]|uniref:RidA family protein n=1 Tax=Nocardia carnea TaxID=37328 RepID=UPI002454ACD7|nr:RidA family protein [Nocardia carnea]